MHPHHRHHYLHHQCTTMTMVIVTITVTYTHTSLLIISFLSAIIIITRIINSMDLSFFKTAITAMTNVYINFPFFSCSGPWLCLRFPLYSFSFFFPHEVVVIVITFIVVVFAPLNPNNFFFGEYSVQKNGDRIPTT